MYVRGFNWYLLFIKSVYVKIQIQFIVHLLISGPNAIQIREESKENGGSGAARRNMNNSKNGFRRKFLQMDTNYNFNKSR